MHKYFITGIGTGVGKTVVSAIITESLKANYWKPVQAGELSNSDSLKIKELVSNDKSFIYPEVYKLSQSMSPHAAADMDKVLINAEYIYKEYLKINTDNSLVIEGAGGLMVPLNRNFLVIDLIMKLNLPVILVSQNYLGSINHTLLSIEALRKKNIEIAGIIFNGLENKATEEFILNYSGLKCLLRIPQLSDINQKNIKEYAAIFNI